MATLQTPSTRTWSNLEWTKEDGIGILTLSRPEALNALNLELLDNLSDWINFVDQDRDLRVVIVTGAGQKAFVAGADIKQISELDPTSALRFAEKGQKIFRRLEVLRFPVLACVRGYALGGGLELALACDFIFASEDCVLGLPEVGLGLLPGFGGTQRLARSVGLPTAKRMIFSAQSVKCEEAVKLGLVQRAFSAEQLMAETVAFAKIIAKQAPLAVMASKAALQQGADLPLDEGLMVERQMFSELFRSQDVKEGTRAFIEKRKPVFNGM